MKTDDRTKWNEMTPKCEACFVKCDKCEVKYPRYDPHLCSTFPKFGKKKIA